MGSSAKRRKIDVACLLPLDISAFLAFLKKNYQSFQGLAIYFSKKMADYKNSVHNKDTPSLNFFE
ncbi:hypothetical protein UABAM_02703 [Candidatus Uabimicrobium amorphum]|uniref:Uncharacterized protein n=1 Tax=Uabimicrobium amorphum TaxID=2596890 RepID=A0A5S9IMA9_UABAM|nr:hypothetical protein UABAM_02703 [Candidatus Uabimicrobium amorphum]